MVPFIFDHAAAKAASVLDRHLGWWRSIGANLGGGHA